MELAKLAVTLGPNEASEVGKSEVSVLELARLTLDFWDKRLSRT